MTQTDPTPPDAQTKKRGRPWAILRAVGLFLVLPLLFMLMAGVLVINRDIDAPDWIKSRIESRAAEMLQGGEMRFDQIYVNVGTDLHPRVRLVDLQVFDVNGHQIARIPSVTGLMSPRGLLFEGAVLMQDIMLQGPQLKLDRAADGSVALAFGSGGGFDQAPSLVALLDQSDQILSRPALAALETISANGVVVNYTDARAGRSWTVDGGQVDLDLRGGATALSGDFALLSGGADITLMNLNYNSPRGSRAAQMGVSVTNARARDIASQTPALSWLSDVDASITAALRTSLDSNGNLGLLSATVDLGNGALQPNAATDPVPFDRAKAYLAYDPAADVIRFDQIELDAPAGTLRADGQAILGEYKDGVPGSLVAQFNFPDVTLSQSKLYPDGMVLPSTTVDLRLRFDPFVIELGQVALSDGGSHVTARGEISATGAGWAASVDLMADEMSTTRVVELWPETVKAGSRRWLATNVNGGMIKDAAFAIRAQQGEALGLTARYDFTDANIKFMRSMPPIVGGYGVGHLQDNQMFLSLDRGSVTPAQGGPMDVAGTTMTVLDTRVAGSDARLRLAMAGTITSALSLLDRDPFRFVSKGGQSVTMADGRADVRGTLQFPLRPGVTQDQIAYDITANLRDVQSRTIIKDRYLRASRMRLTANPDGLRIAGDVTLDGVPADVTWTKRFGARHAGKSDLQATLSLTPAALDAFNIALPKDMVSGAGQGALAVNLVKDQPPAFRLTSNLRGIGLTVPSVGWRKPPNARGELVVAGTLGPVPNITTLDVSGGGLQASGAVALNDNGSLDEARFSSVKIGDWLSAPVTLRGRGKGRPVGVSIGQGRIDLRGAKLGGGSSEGGPMTLRLDRLQITEGIALHRFRGEFSGAGGFSGDFSGRVNGGPEIQGTVVPQNGRSALRIRSDDAGGVIGAAGFLKNGVGGGMDLTLRPVGLAGTFDGDLKVTNLRVRDAPAVAALLDSISVVGLLRQLDGQGLAFDTVDAAFRLSPTHVVVTQSSAVGPGLGISLDGIYTLGSKQVDFQGVVSPFYFLNGIASFLTRRGEGLIGFNFNLSGDARSPAVAVNPLSILTPGMFRDIFRRPPPQVTQ